MSEEETELSKYLNQAKYFQKLLLEYIDNDEPNFQNIQNYFDEQNILGNKQKLMTNLCFISKISNNHHRSSNFFDKIEKIILYFQSSYKTHCTNIELFNICKENKLLLLILFKNKIIEPDAEIKSIITTETYKARNYPQYFWNEFKSLKNDQPDDISFEPPDNFDNNRITGENENYICELIRKDDAVSFVKHVNQTNTSLSSLIPTSIYETNPLLLEKRPTMIEYALFFGSIQIIKYMTFNKVEIPESGWQLVIHSKNNELIHLLEENKIQPPTNSFNEVLFECVKYHHNEIADYVLSNIFSNKLESDLKMSFSLEAVRHHNYHFIPDDYEFITGNPCFIVTMTESRNYELVYILLHMRVGPGILCSCIDAKIGDNTKYTLFCTVENNDIEMIKVLMSSETFNTYGKSTINRRVGNDESEVKYVYTDSKTALYLAVENKLYDVVQLLLNSDNECNINEESELFDSQEESLLTIKNKYTKMPIHVAIENGDNKMLQILLSSKSIDVNIEYKFVKDVERPFQYNMNQVEKKTPLQISVEKENAEAVRLLLSHKSIDANKACSFKLDKKLDGYEYDEDNQGNEEEEQQGDNERDKQIRSKKTALHLAVEKNNIEIIKLLLNYSKTDINVREKYKLVKPLLKIDTQKTALQIAIEKKEVDVVRLLLEQRSISLNERIPYRLDRDAKTVNYYDDEDNENNKPKEMPSGHHEYCLKTPLHSAVLTGCVEIIKLLLQQKTIDTQIDDGQGKKPIDYTENQEIKSLFKK